MPIAFQGPIAAGKTTLATLNSEYSGGSLILKAGALLNGRRGGPTYAGLKCRMLNQLTHR